MSEVLWNAQNWDTFFWNGYGAGFKTEMDKLTGTKPIFKVEILLDAGTVDVTEWYKGGANFDQKREIAPDRITSGDTTFAFSNHDDKFTETDSSSIFYGIDYYNRKIRFSSGFKIPGGGNEYATQFTAYIKDVSYDFEGAQVYIVTMDIARYLIDARMNTIPTGALPIPGSNTGTGTCTEIATIPFAVVGEDWTLTCTTPGADSVAIFSVVGSVSGNIGNATSGTEFQNATYGIELKLEAGGVAWVGADSFTFTTYQYPEWTSGNPAKIIWGLLTGVNYDTGANEAWKSRTLQLDSTRNDSNPDINWTSLADTVSKVSMPVTGYIPRDFSVTTAIEELHILFLGATTIDGSGRIKLRAFYPTLGTPRNFADTKKIAKRMRRQKKVKDIINSASCKTKRSASWAWSDASENYNYIYSQVNTTSISDYKETRHKSFTSRWLSVNFTNGKPEAQSWFIDRIVDRYREPPTKIDFITGTDALLTESGDIISVTDSDSDLAGESFDVFHLKKDFSSSPVKISIISAQDTTQGLNWVFWGSSADEGDDISPQAANHDNADSVDKQFVYWSQTGASTQPLYYFF